MGRGDVPTAVAISLKKRRQASLDSGAFTQEGLKTFVERLVSGKTSTHPLQAGHPCFVSVRQLCFSEAICISASRFLLLKAQRRVACQSRDLVCRCYAIQAVSRDQSTSLKMWYHNMIAMHMA